MRARLRSAEDLLARAEGAVLVALLAVMVTLAFAQVVLRRFDAGLLWGDTVLKQLVMWTGFLGAALAAHAEKNFAWEASNLGTPQRWKQPLRLLASLAGAFVCALMLQAAWRYAADDRSAGEVLTTIGSLTIPSWIGAAGIPGGFALLLAHSLFKAVDAALAALGKP
ncbi:MAG TPA: TRAP transporter small permease subunit [Elusimicrobiota bacterium]|nr:TRAP transporter small permease subunit [Elusimicrobiota bacterium]